jgi:hypothetical protein
MRIKLYAVLALACVLGGLVAMRAFAAESAGGTVEYATIKWAGRDNTHVVLPGGKVEFLGPQFRNFAKPDRTDDRAFYMNLAINALGKQGFELAGMSSDEIVMRRSPVR